jgi:hypothetical protein
MQPGSRIAPALVVLTVAAAVSWAVRSPVDSAGGLTAAADLPGEPFDEIVATVNQFFTERWEEQGVLPSDEAEELEVLRRLSLSLHGTIPSLEEIREFEADDAPDRLNRWTARLLAEPRFADYFAERLARFLVGTDEGEFIIYRRDRFVEWLSEQLRQRRGYDEIVRDLISTRGLWTGKPASNFVTVTINEGEVDENRLAGRAVRAFLGQRIDCAQCHDHPFDRWKQSEFEGLASYFGQSKLSLVGVEDDADLAFQIENRETLESRVIAPAVPYRSDWLPKTGTRREQLAAWITHPENRRFERAIANRIWGLLFGKPYLEPVDDLPDPDEAGATDLLDIVAADFRQQGCDLARLIQVIAGSRPFRLASTYESPSEADYDRAASVWAVFPLVKLRPEQMVGAMLQSASLQTIDQNSHLLVRTIRFFRERDFVEKYGDLGENELENRSTTIPQMLLRMNGSLPHELLKGNPLNASGRIAAFTASDERCLESCYLVCLTRRPTATERNHFLPQLRGTDGKERGQVVEDIFWSLFNSPEF